MNYNMSKTVMDESDKHSWIPISLASRRPEQRRSHRQSRRPIASLHSFSFQKESLRASLPVSGPCIQNKEFSASRHDSTFTQALCLDSSSGVARSNTRIAEICF